MANYQELLSKAVAALPQSNGEARREVYEKARKALVTQLRAITPPLPAREITQHRLELEDCIRQVEHEATEALLESLKESPETSIPLEPEESEELVVGQEIVEEPASGQSLIEEPVAGSTEPKADSLTDRDEVLPEETPIEKSPMGETDLEVGSTDRDEEVQEDDLSRKSADELNETLRRVSMDSEGSDKVEDVGVDNLEAGLQENGESPSPVEQDRDEKNNGDESESAGNAALDAIIARAEQAKTSSAGFVRESSREAGGSASPSADAVVAPLSDSGVGLSDVKMANSTVSRSDLGGGAAMSQVREIENTAPGAEPGPMIARINAPDPEDIGSRPVADDDAQLVVDKAIETLDREARGETGFEEYGESEFGSGENRLSADDGNMESGFSLGDDEEKGGNGLTIFLVLVILLLGAVGGGAYYAWREGYIDLEALFASDGVADSQQVGVENGDVRQSEADNANPVRIIENGSQNPNVGNTATQVDDNGVSNANVALEDVNKIDDRLPSGLGNGAVADANDRATEPENGAVKVEDRLGAGTEAPDTALVQEGGANGQAIVDSAQSLLLEASADGASGAVPFSGTVEWSRGVDELGEPTIIGQANIPAKNLGVRILIRRNADRSLPASHLMEIDFEVSSAFPGGSIAGLPGILLKNEELVQGAALVGASARVVGNSFLFALSAADADVRTNLDLLQNRKWMDLAMIYSSGRRAIITLEKDESAQTMFDEVMAIWANSDAQAAAANDG